MRKAEPTKQKKAVRILIACFAISVGLLFWPLPDSHHRIAPRTSPLFDKRPKSDALVKAAENGDLEAMTKLLDSGVSPNADSSGDEGRSALSEAAAGGHLEAVKLLLARGADVNAEDSWGENALVSASLWGNVDVVRLLISKGA